jgi:hypothetical protein
MIIRTLACLAAGLSLSTVVNAAIINLTPADINGGNTNTTSFSDGALTLTPFVRDATGTPVADTFNANATRLGIDNNPLGTNNNGFTDGDTTVGNEGEELMTFDFVATSGLTQISYDFSRADGPGANDGVVISGFLADPNVTFSVSNPNLFAVYSGGSVRINIPGVLFGGALTEINFDPTRSAGQSLTMTVNDTTQAGAQLAIRGIAYDNDTIAVPEPSSLVALCVVGAGAVARRRKRNV